MHLPALAPVGRQKAVRASALGFLSVMKPFVSRELHDDRNEQERLKRSVKVYTRLDTASYMSLRVLFGTSRLSTDCSTTRDCPTAALIINSFDALVAPACSADIRYSFRKE